jgi:hypothetical protein
LNTHKMFKVICDLRLSLLSLISVGIIFIEERMSAETGERVCIETGERVRRCRTPTPTPDT